MCFLVITSLHALNHYIYRMGNFFFRIEQYFFTNQFTQHKSQRSIRYFIIPIKLWPCCKYSRKRFTSVGTLLPFKADIGMTSSKLTFSVYVSMSANTSSG